MLGALCYHEGRGVAQAKQFIHLSYALFPCSDSGGPVARGRARPQEVWRDPVFTEQRRVLLDRSQMTSNDFIVVSTVPSALAIAELRVGPGTGDDALFLPRGAQSAFLKDGF